MEDFWAIKMFLSALLFSAFILVHQSEQDSAWTGVAGFLLWVGYNIKVLYDEYKESI
jgi:hypothetical protein